MCELSVIVPCFNEEESLLLFYQSITKVLSSMAISYELLMVNDGSQDKTLTILKTFSQQDKHLYYISFSRNFGKEAAMYAGLQHAQGNFAVILDADLQHPVDLLPIMYHAVSKEGYDCCAGKRVDRQGEGHLRNFLSHSFYRLINHLTHFPMNDGAGDFRMMNRKMINAIVSLKENTRYMKGIFSFVGFDTKWIEFHNVQRVAGQSKWHLKQLIGYAFDGIFSFSNALAGFTGLLGFLFLMISLCLMGYGLFHHLNHLLWLAALVLMLSGLQTLCISIVGQYSARDYLEGKQRPVYIIKDTNTPTL